MDSGRVDFYGRLAVGKDARLRIWKSANRDDLLFEIGEDFTIYLDAVETISRLVDILEQAKRAFGPDAPEHFTRESPVDWLQQARAEGEDRQRTAARMLAA